jgi:isopenicillin N synthase-like dioxygenase
MSLPRININDNNFNDLVYDAMQNQRGFIITHLGAEFTQHVNNLLNSFDDFRNQSDEIKESFKGAQNGFSGYFPPDKYKFGGKSTTERFFISRNKQNQLTQDLPKPAKVGVSMDKANESLLAHTQPIADRIIQAIEDGLKLQQEKLIKLANKSSLMTLTHYLPTTQEKLQTMFKDSQMTVTEDGEIKTFEEHKDLTIFSMLIYRENKTDGLKLKIPNEHGKKEYKTVDLNDKENEFQEARIIVMVGRMLQYLTNGALRGLKHTVVTKPLSEGEEFSRNNIAVFISHDSDIQLIPFFENQNNSQPNHDTHHDFTSRYIESYNNKIKTMTLQELPKTVLDFPKDDEIECNETDKGIVYTRRKMVS